jgi:phenylacetate-CoA ligase
VKEFVIKQTKIDTFDIEYVSSIELNENQIKDIEKAITTYLETGLNFTFIKKDKLERGKKW